MPSRAIQQVIAPGGGKITQYPDQSIPPQAWSRAEFVRFRNGTARRWSGWRGISTEKGVAVASHATYANTGTWVTGTPTTIGFSSMTGNDNRCLVFVLMADAAAAANEPIVQFGTSTSASGPFTDWIATNYTDGDYLTLNGTEQDGRLVLATSYITGTKAVYIYTLTGYPPSVAYSIIYAITSVGGVFGSDAYAGCVEYYNVDQDNPVLASNTKGGALGSGANSVSVTWSVPFDTPVIGGIADDPTPTVGASTVAIDTGGAASGFLPMASPSPISTKHAWEDGLDGEPINFTAAGSTWASAAIALRGIGTYQSNIGLSASDEVPLAMYDYVVNSATRHFVLVTTEHVYRYDGSNDQWIPIDALQPTGTFENNTGTVDVGTTTVVEGSGVDFSSPAVAEDDLMQITDFSGGDDTFRVIWEVTDSDTVQVVPAFGEQEAGRAFSIRRPVAQFTLDNKPWTVGYLGTLYIGSKSETPWSWDGSANFMDDVNRDATLADDDLPKASCAAIIANHLMLGNTTVGGTDEPRRVRWSDFGEPLDFDTDGSPSTGSESGYLDIADSQEPVNAVAKLAEYGVVYTFDSIHLLTYVGGAFVFTRRQIVNNFGLVARDALSVLSDRHLFVGTNNIYELTPAGLRPIGDPIWEEFMQDLDLEYAELINSAVDIVNQEWLVAYPSKSAPVVSLNGTDYRLPDKLLIYNYKEGLWSDGTIDHWTAMGGGFIVRSGGQVPLAELDIPANTYPRFYDESADAAKAFRLFASSADNDGGTNKVVEITEDTAQNSVLERTGIRLQISTKDGLEDTDQVCYVDRVWLGLTSGPSTGLLYVSVGARMEEGDEYEWSAPIEYDMDSGDGYINVYARGREFGIRIETRDDTDARYKLERWRLEGQPGGMW